MTKKQKIFVVEVAVRGEVLKDLVRAESKASARRAFVEAWVAVHEATADELIDAGRKGLELTDDIVPDDQEPLPLQDSPTS